METMTENSPKVGSFFGKMLDCRSCIVKRKNYNGSIGVEPKLH